LQLLLLLLLQYLLWYSNSYGYCMKILLFYVTKEVIWWQ
jgi:hypothetical protein